MSLHIPALAFVAMLAACGSDKDTKPAARSGPRAFPVEVTTVEERVLEFRVEAVGTLEASEIVQVTSRVAGVVEKVAFREGDVVDPERILVEIEPERFRLAVEQARANATRAEAAEREARAALAKREELRKKDPGWVSAEELTSLESALEVARAEVAQQKAALALAELNLHEALVRAPIAGTIQARHVQPGQYVEAGAALAELVRTHPLFVRFKVPERDAARLAKGQRAELNVRSTDSASVAARLVHVGQVADPKSRMVECLARLDSGVASSRDSPRDSLRPGVFAEVVVPTGSSGRVPVVPEGAIRPTEHGFVVYVVEDGKARERVIEIGSRTADGHMEVRSGLAPGETLVTRGAQYLRPDAAVEIKPSAGSENAPPSEDTP